MYGRPYNLFLDTGKPSGLYGRIRKSLGLTHRKELLRIFWIDTYEIELEHPELAGMPESPREDRKSTLRNDCRLRLA
jgi:hypothetical protein